jgi:hypothetical protein
MLELVADLLLADFLIIVVRIAAAQLVDLAVGTDERTDIHVGLVRLYRAVDGKGGRLVRLPGDGRLEEVTVVGDVEIGVAPSCQADDAVEHAVVFLAQRASEIKHRLNAILGAVEDADLADRLFRRIFEVLFTMPPGEPAP